MSELLQIVHLSKAFWGRRVIDDVCLNVRAGEIVGLLGPNGAGKTTVFRIAAGTMRPSAGRVLFDGRDISRLPLHRRARECRIGYLPQIPSLFGRLSVYDNIAGFMKLLGFERETIRNGCLRLLTEFGLSEIAELSAEQLSGGQKRRLEIARTLLTEPRLILMDEPFAGIDPVTVADLGELLAALRRRGIGILISEHNVRETLRFTDRCYIIAGGKMLVEGSPSALLQNDEARRCYFGDDIDSAPVRISESNRRLAA